MKLASLPRVWRTLRALRAEQAWAQFAYATRGLGPPVRLQGAAPDLQIAQTTVPFLPAPAHARVTGERLELLNVEIDLGDPPDLGFRGRGSALELSPPPIRLAPAAGAFGGAADNATTRLGSASP